MYARRAGHTPAQGRQLQDGRPALWSYVDLQECARTDDHRLTPLSLSGALAVSGLARTRLARSVACSGCGITCDRDLKAARNILVEGPMVSAGVAETQNARGGGIRLGLVSGCPVKRETAKVPRERHGRNPGH